ncbi:efflux RND transporter periplasmic adaptor subunit [Marinicella litoralis]|uniref:Cu(I)/Ag(I) efflux system membrane fusion protein n=1 Tax=Marinicella litoralis TaxID=644220 RepID=A0A4R6XJP9_9GAMM|nr:efflux RND transporter periplasmic adaptor subunit [Marinicella litoralis]TDR17443.1 Cu(I)/Ag(I) efflux system membrane fusion protein [Marinicella litoralis]
MNNSRNQIIIGLFAGLVIGVAMSYFYFSSVDQKNNASASTKNEKVPLYWVAPMDPNYRRDEPGQSPMGMDLIPYYGDSNSAEDNPGAIKISPNVVNNLGVRTARAEIRSVGSNITAMGLVKYNEEQMFHIHPRVEGWIETLYIKSSGQTVEKDQALYEMYSPELVNAQEEFILALKRGNDRLIQAAEDRLKSLQFTSEQIKQLKQSRVTKQKVTFYSQHQGVVTDLPIRAGFYVKPGMTLMSVAQLENIWVEVDVLEKQATMIQLTQSVDMTLEYLPGRIWHGQVDFIYPSMDPMTRTLKIRLKFENVDQVLRPNMFAQVNIHTIGDHDVLVVPAEAVIRTGQADRLVLALGSGQFKSVKVTIGSAYDDYIEIIDGIAVDDQVVISAQFLLDSESSKSSDFKRMSEPAMDHSKMDHSKMDHSKMDHSKMDHSKMDHSQKNQSTINEPETDHSKMDHSQMDHSKKSEPEIDYSKMDHSKMDHSKMNHSNVNSSEMSKDASDQEFQQ